jgi:Holliday junction resolvase RusA-like endonuclease
MMSVFVYLPIPVSWSRRKRERARGRPTPTRPDLDNYIKAAMDICGGIVFRDDAQVVLIGSSKMYSDNPRLEIDVSPW